MFLARFGVHQSYLIDETTKLGSLDLLLLLFWILLAYSDVEFSLKIESFFYQFHKYGPACIFVASRQ